jgi:hypothetical protein
MCEPGLGDRDVEGRWVGNTRQWSHEDKGTKGLKEKNKARKPFSVESQRAFKLGFL